MYSLAFLGIVSFLASLLLTPLVRRLFLSRGVVDRPDSKRKLHERPVATGGGAAIALSYVLSFGILLILPLNAGLTIQKGLPLTSRLIPSAILVLAIGFLDDVFDLRPWQKLLGQMAAAGGAFWAGIHIATIVGHPISVGLSVSLTIGWLMFCTNALNLIDGLDGLATGLGLFASATTLVAAFLQGNVPLALATAPLIGALLGFLRYNFNPATIFLGDSGSLFVGFLLGCYGVLWSQKSTTLLGMTAPLLALAVPLLDTALVVVRRFLRRQPIFAADRSHIHHQLLQRGFTPRRVAFSLYAICGVGAVCSLAIMEARAAGVIVMFFSLLIIVGVWGLGYTEFGTAARMLTEGAFRGQLNARIALQSFERALAAARTPLDCWIAIQAAAPTFGLRPVRMSIGDHHFRDRQDATFVRHWTVYIPFSDTDCLELIHEFDNRVSSDATASFADVIRKSLTCKLDELHGLEPRYRTPASGGQPLMQAQTCIFINQFFWPDPAATSQLLTDLTADAVEKGHLVRVISGASRYTNMEDLILPPVQILRCPATPFRRSLLGRVSSYVSFLIPATFHALRGRRPDAIVTMTTPPALHLLGTLVRSLRGARHYIWEMDLYPDVAIELGIFSPRSPVTRLVSWAFNFARRRAEGIIAVGEEMKERLIAHGIPAEKIHVCENWADSRDIAPLPFPRGPLTLYYSGNLGLVHDVETVLAAIEYFRDDKGVRFLFAGGGSQRAAFEATCTDRGLTNVLFGPYCERPDLGLRLAQGHLGLVTQLPSSLGCVVPSKTYGILAAGRPLLFIGPKKATPARIIEMHECGWHVEPGDSASLITLLEMLSVRRELIEEAGARARKAFERNYDRSIGVARINKVLGLSPPLFTDENQTASSLARLTGALTQEKQYAGARLPAAQD